MKFKEVATPTYISVREFTEPFEGVYVGKVEGKHGSNYLFSRDGRQFVVYGVKSVHEKMSAVTSGLTVRLTKIAEHRSLNGGTFVEVLVEVGEASCDPGENDNHE